MGRVKSAQIKKAAKKLFEERKAMFSTDFDKNKVAVAKLLDTSKKTRNSIAGYVTRLMKAKMH